MYESNGKIIYYVSSLLLSIGAYRVLASNKRRYYQGYGKRKEADDEHNTMPC